MVRNQSFETPAFLDDRRYSSDTPADPSLADMGSGRSKLEELKGLLESYSSVNNSLRYRLEALDDAGSGERRGGVSKYHLQKELVIQIVQSVSKKLDEISSQYNEKEQQFFTM